MKIILFNTIFSCTIFTMYHQMFLSIFTMYHQMFLYVSLWFFNMNQNIEIYFAFIFFHINLVFLSHLWKDIMISSMFSSSIFLFQKDFCSTFLHILAAFFHDILLLLPFDYLNDNNFLNILLFFLCVYHYTLFYRSFFW